jgi:hypothetical protein
VIRLFLTSEDAQIVAHQIARVISWGRDCRASVLIHAVNNACQDYIEAAPTEKRVLILGDHHMHEIVGNHADRVILDDFSTVRFIESQVLRDGSRLEMKTVDIGIPKISRLIKAKDFIEVSSDFFIDRRPQMYRTARERRNALRNSPHIMKKKR